MIYFIQAMNGAPIKIGYAKNPAARLLELRVGSASPLELLGVLDGEVRDEKRLHRALAAHRIRGEWFTPNVLRLAPNLQKMEYRASREVGRPFGIKRIRRTLRLREDLSQRVEAIAGAFNSRTKLFDEIFTAGLPAIERGKAA